MLNMLMYILYGFVLNPLVNLWCAFLIHPVNENITQIGWGDHNFLPYLIWIISTLIGQSFFTEWFIKKWQIKLDHLSLIAGIMMFIAGLFPYVDSRILKSLHVWGAVGGMLVFIVIWLYIFLQSFYRNNQQINLIAAGVLMIMLSGFILILYTGQVSGLSEIFYSVFCNAWLAYWIFKFKKTKKAFMS